MPFLFMIINIRLKALDVVTTMCCLLDSLVF